MKNLTNHVTLYWWNCGTKTLQFKGELKDLLKDLKIKLSVRKTETGGIYLFTFKNEFITFKIKGTSYDLPYYAKQFLQMELCRMGDKSVLYVEGVIRSEVTVNF